jgi:hypothetical protein
MGLGWYSPPELPEKSTRTPLESPAPFEGKRNVSQQLKNAHKGHQIGFLVVG